MSLAPRSHRVRPWGPTSPPDLFLNKASSLSVWHLPLLSRPPAAGRRALILQPQALGRTAFPRGPRQSRSPRKSAGPPSLERGGNGFEEVRYQSQDWASGRGSLCPGLLAPRGQGRPWPQLRWELGSAGRAPAPTPGLANPAVPSPLGHGQRPLCSNWGLGN